jgi:spore coat protein H
MRISRASWRLGLGVAALCTLAATSVRAQSQADFFDDSSLQEVRLVLNSRDWEELKATADENTYYPADMTWKSVTVRNIGIRSRGNGTRNGLKPGLRVDFNRYLTNQSFLDMKAVVLDNAYTDPTTLRESVAMKLYAGIGLPTPREAHAKLYVNNEYVGIYIVADSVDRTFITRLFGTDEGNTEFGGYLFEFRWQFYWYLEYLGSELKTYASLFKPQTRDTDAVAVIYTPIEAMIRAINDAPDDQFEAQVGKYLDLDEFMKYLAVEQFTTEWDGFAGNWATNNFYLYRFRSNGISQIIPWDKDHAFTFLDVPIMFRLDQNVLTRRAMNVPALRQVFFDTLAQLAAIADAPASADDSRPYLQREVERQWGLMADSLAADPLTPFTFDQAQTDYQFLRQFGYGRSAYVRCDVARTLDPSADQDCVFPALPPEEKAAQEETLRRVMSRITTPKEKSSH